MRTCLKVSQNYNKMKKCEWVLSHFNLFLTRIMLSCLSVQILLFQQMVYLNRYYSELNN